MKKFLISLTCLAQLALAQSNFYETVYLPSETISKNLAKDSMFQQAAWNYSFIGEYANALKVWDKDELKAPALRPQDSILFAGLKPVKALDYIAKIAEKEQIIIINEAHQQPYHRVFTKSLLKTLFNKGFKYFGAETLNNYPSAMDSLNKDKYPKLRTGFYSVEPQMGDLIRSAAQQGYNIFAYESNVHPDTSHGVIREIEQAKNIKKILDKDPKAKILIHCGFGHITEGPVYGWGKAMAGRLQEYTGIDPFTIDQVKLTEHGSIEFDNPFFLRMNLDYFAFFIDSAGRPFKGPAEVNEYNARVYHPRTKWINGRPHWVFEDGRKAIFINDKINVSYPCLVFAYNAKEKYNAKKAEDMAVPFDIIELKSKEDKKALSLKKGDYVIIIKDEKGKEQTIKITN